MRETIHAGRGRLMLGQGAQEVRVVDHDTRPGGRIGPGPFLPTDLHAVERRHLRSRQGRRNRDERRMAARGDRLAKSNGRAAADGRYVVRSRALERINRGENDVFGTVRLRVGEHVHTARPKRRECRLISRGTARRACQQHALAAELIELAVEVGDAACPEQHASGRCCVDKFRGGK